MFGLHTLIVPIVSLILIVIASSATTSTEVLTSCPWWSFFTDVLTCSGIFGLGERYTISVLKIVVPSYGLEMFAIKLFVQDICMLILDVLNHE